MKRSDKFITIHFEEDEAIELGKELELIKKRYYDEKVNFIRNFPITNGLIYELNFYEEGP